MTTSVVAVGGEFSTAVAAELIAWRTVGLLNDFILLGEDGDVAESSPIVGSSVKIETLLADLGVHDVHLIVVRPSFAETGPLDGVVDRLRMISADATRQSALGLVSVNLLCPPRSAIEGRTEWQSITGVWDHHVIVAPEDRVDERAFTGIDDSASSLAQRAAFSAALVAGLFWGIERPPIDTLKTAGGSVQVLRGFGRVVVAPPSLLGDFRAELESIRTSDVRMKDCVGGLPAKDPIRHVANASKAFAQRADDGVLTYLTYEKQPPPAQIKVTWRVALRMLKDFVIGMVQGQIHRMTTGAAERAKEAALKRVNDILFGQGSAYRVVFDANLEGSEVSAASMAEQLLSNDSSEPVNLPAHPRVWRELREAIFSLVDGSPPLTYLPQSSFNGQPLIVASPELLAPDPASDHLPAASWSDSQLPAISRACDALAVVHRRLALQKATTNIVDEISDEGETPAGNIGASLLKDLESWEETRRGAFTYNVAKHVGEALSQAELVLQRDLEGLQSLAEKKEEDETLIDEKKKKKRRRRRIRVVMTALAIVIFLVAPALALAIGAIAVVVWVVLQVATIAITVVRLFRRWMKRLQTQFQEQHRLLLEGYEVQELVESTLHNSREVLRLAALYDELLEWSDVLGVVVHRPFSAYAGEEDLASVQISGPLSLSVADATVLSARLERLSAQLASRVFSKGWMARLFTEKSQDANAELRWQRGEQAVGQGLDADYDVAAQRGDAKRLLQALESQDRRVLLDDAVGAFVANLPVIELFEPEVVNQRTSAICEIAEFLEGIRPMDPVTGFDSSLSTFAGREELRKVIEPPLSWGLDSEQLGCGVVDKEAHGTFRVTWRLDVGEPASISNLRHPIRSAQTDQASEILPDA